MLYASIVAWSHFIVSTRQKKVALLPSLCMSRLRLREVNYLVQVPQSMVELKSKARQLYFQNLLSCLVISKC